MLVVNDVRHLLFEKFRFRPSTRRRKASVLKNLHFGKRFRKDAISVTVFTEYVYSVSQIGKKISVFNLK